MPSKIFVSYRRDDDPSGAARVRDGLAAKFGKANVFMDVDNLLAGQRFDDELAKALAACDVLVAIMGPRWTEQLHARSGLGQRDYVREEIAGALQRRIVVIPVRVGREGQLLPLPRPEDLPADISELVHYQKHDVAHERFGRDIAELIEAITLVRRARRSTDGSGSNVPWRWITATAASVLLVGWVAAYSAGVPIWVPWQGSPERQASADTSTFGRQADAAASAKARAAEIASAAASKDQATRIEAARVEAARIEAAARDQAAKLEATRRAEADARSREIERSRAELAAREAEEKRQADAQARSRTASASASTAPALPVTRSPDVIRVGVLHSLSGTMAISETTLKDVTLMLVEEQNKKGGLLGKRLEAVVVDPASNWPLFAEKARELIARQKVDVTFGGYTSVSRKSVLPVFKELNSILFYPPQFEGEESERNVFYTGAAPNQQAIPAVDYLISREGGEVRRWVLAGTDFVYPRTTNKILEAYLKSRQVSAQDIMINYTPFGHSDWTTIVADIKRFASAGKKTAVISTINGDANVPFYVELGRQGIKATNTPVLALSVGEEELAGLDTKHLVGHLSAASYFQSVATSSNRDFVAKWRAVTKNPRRVANDAMEAHYIGFNMWIKAVEKAGTTQTDRVIDAMAGIEVPNLTGGTAVMQPSHYISKPLFVGEIRADGQFDVVWKTAKPVAAEAWSSQLDGSKDLIADWTRPVSCGSFNVKTRKCGS